MMQSGASSVEFDGASSAVRHIYQKEGVGGFFRGCMANNVRAIASALVLVLYDEGRSTSEFGFGCWCNMYILLPRPSGGGGRAVTARRRSTRRGGACATAASVAASAPVARQRPGSSCGGLRGPHAGSRRCRRARRPPVCRRCRSCAACRSRPCSKPSTVARACPSRHPKILKSSPKARGPGPARPRRSGRARCDGQTSPPARPSRRRGSFAASLRGPRCGWPR